MRSVKWLRLSTSLLAFPAASPPALPLGRRSLLFLSLFSGSLGRLRLGVGFSLFALFFVFIVPGLPVSLLAVCPGPALIVPGVSLGLSSLDLQAGCNFGMEIFSESSLDHIRSFMVN